MGLELKSGLLKLLDVRGTPVMRAGHLVHRQRQVPSLATEAFRDFLIERGEAMLAEPDAPVLGRQG